MNLFRKFQSFVPHFETTLKLDLVKDNLRITTFQLLVAEKYFAYFELVLIGSNFLNGRLNSPCRAKECVHVNYVFELLDSFDSTF
jgi:hypothetical protein